MSVKETSHTPGPWELGEDCPWTCGDSRTAVEEGADFGHTEILTPLIAGGDPIGYLVWEPLCDVKRADELRANARLIAAAPEMHAILRAVVSTIDATGGIADSDEDDGVAADPEWLDLRMAYDDACALLARIDGK